MRLSFIVDMKLVVEPLEPRGLQKESTEPRLAVKRPSVAASN